MSAYAVENRLRRWFTGEEHTDYEINDSIKCGKNITGSK